MNARLVSALLFPAWIAAGAVVPALAAAATAPAPFRVPVPVVRRLDNGLEVAVFRESRLPIVQIELFIPAGVVDEPASQPGLANATVQLLKQGTASRPAAEFTAELNRLGGTLACSAARDNSTISGQFLASDFEAGLDLISDAVLHPLFANEEVEKFQSVMSSALAQLRQDRAEVADEQVWMMAFSGTPYGTPPFGTQAALADLSRDAVASFHRDFYRPAHAVLVIAGDVDPERALAAATEVFSSWAGQPKASSHAVPTDRRLPGVRIGIVDRPGQRQTEVRIGLLAPPRGSDDFLAFQIANFLLGGSGFSSRLTQSMRLQDGLAYDARSNYTALADVGLLTVGTFVGTDSVGTVVDRVRKELRRFVDSPPATDQIENARRYFGKVFPLQFETLGSIAGQWLGTGAYGLPGADLQKYPERIQTVTGEQVAAAARRWFDPDHLVIVAVGPADRLEPRLAALGSVERIVLDGTPAPAAKSAPTAIPAPTDESRKHAHAVLAQALVAHGGPERLRNVKDSVIDGDLTIGKMGSGKEVSGKIEQVRKEPFKMVFSTEFATFTTQQILNGTKAWARMVYEDSVLVADADSSTMLGLRAGYSLDIVHVLLSAAGSQARVNDAGQNFVDGHGVDGIEVEAPGEEVRRLWFDHETHRLLALDLSRGGDGVFVQRRVYKDYRPVGGIQWPFLEVRSLNGEPSATVQLKQAAINQGIADSRFGRPAERRVKPGR